MELIYTRGIGTGLLQHINIEITLRNVIAIQNLIILKGFLQIHNYRKTNPHPKVVKTVLTES